MKYLILISCFCFFAVSSHAQTGVPEKARQDFARRYPNSTPKWAKDETEHVAEFMKDKVEMEVVYDASGDWKMTESKMDVKKLAANIVEYLKKKYPNHEMKDAEHQESTNGQFTEVTIRHNGKAYGVIFDASGNFVREEME